MSIGDPWPDLDEAEVRVLAMQRKLRHWAKTDPGRRFDDLHNLVYDPCVLVIAWERVRGNKGARTAGVDGIAPRSVGFGAGELLSGPVSAAQGRAVRSPAGAGEGDPEGVGHGLVPGDSDDRGSGRAGRVEAGA